MLLQEMRKTVRRIFLSHFLACSLCKHSNNNNSNAKKKKLSVEREGREGERKEKEAAMIWDGEIVCEGKLSE
jgi:hypothetical protein